MKRNSVLYSPVPLVSTMYLVKVQTFRHLSFILGLQIFDPILSWYICFRQKNVTGKKIKNISVSRSVLQIRELTLSFIKQWFGCIPKKSAYLTNIGQQLHSESGSYNYSGNIWTAIVAHLAPISMPLMCSLSRQRAMLCCSLLLRLIVSIFFRRIISRV